MWALSGNKGKKRNDLLAQNALFVMNNSNHNDDDDDVVFQSSPIT